MYKKSMGGGGGGGGVMERISMEMLYII